MNKREDTKYGDNEKNLLAVEKDFRANELQTIGNTGGRSMLKRPSPQSRRVANPDDPLVRQSPRGPKGVMPGPNYLGLQGRTAIVQGQVFIVAVILVTQLWLVTDALFELLSGYSSPLLWLALVSFVGFVLAFLVAFWPRRRIEES